MPVKAARIVVAAALFLLAIPLGLLKLGQMIDLFMIPSWALDPLHSPEAR